MSRLGVSIEVVVWLLLWAVCAGTLLEYSSAWVLGFGILLMGVGVIPLGMSTAVAAWNGALIAGIGGLFVVAMLLRANRLRVTGRPSSGIWSARRRAARGGKHDRPT